jgi:hypothetical protein
MPTVHYSPGLDRAGLPIIQCAVRHDDRRLVITVEVERVTCKRCLRSLLWTVCGERPYVGGLGTDE